MSILLNTIYPETILRGHTKRPWECMDDLDIRCSGENTTVQIGPRVNYRIFRVFTIEVVSNEGEENGYKYWACKFRPTIYHHLFS